MLFRLTLSSVILLAVFSVYSQSSYVNIRWPEVPYADSYLIQVYADKKMKVKLVDKRVKRPLYRWQNPKPGTYYMRLATKDKWKQIGPFSGLSELKVSPAQFITTPPRPITPDNYSALEGDELYFSWEKSPGSISHEILIADNREFNTPIIRKRTIKSGLKIELNSLDKRNKYYWKVRTADVGKKNLESEIFVLNDLPLGSTRAALGNQDEAPSRGKSWSAFFGVTTTYMKHEEKLNSIKQTQVAGTLKGGVAYKVTPRFDFGTVIFSNVLVLSNDSQTSPDRKVTGINLRSGYLLSNINLKVSIGYYYWTINSINGDFAFFGSQIFLNSSLPINRANYVYAKMAPLQESLSNIELGNIEYAIGGGIQVLHPKLFAILDVSVLNYDDPLLRATLNNSTYSLGIQYNF